MHVVVLLAAALAVGPGPTVERMTPEELRQWLEAYEVEYERGPRSEPAGGVAPGRREPEAQGLSGDGEGVRAPPADGGSGEDRLVASVLVCYADDALTAARAAIRAEKRTTRSAGVANLTNLYEQRTRTERAARARRAKLIELRERGLRPLPCSRPDVAHFVACMHGMDSVSVGDWCDDGAWQDFRERQGVYGQIDWE